MSRSFWLAWLVLSVARPVFAAELHWDAPEGCPDVHALEREAEQVLGEPLANYPLKVAGRVTQDAAQLTLSLRITVLTEAETRERALQATSCSELLEAAAVAIALAAAESGERPGPVALEQNTEPREPPPRAAVVQAPASDMHIALSAAALSGVGALPAPGFGGELQLAWMQRWLRVGLAATWFPERSMHLTDDLRGSFSLYLGELLLCGQYDLPAARLFGCVTGAIGRMGAQLDPPAAARFQSTAWRALGVRLGISYPILPPLELTASLALVAPLTRPRFYMQPGSDMVLHEPAALNAALLLGALISL